MIRNSQNKKRKVNFICEFELKIIFVTPILRDPQKIDIFFDASAYYSSSFMFNAFVLS